MRITVENESNVDERIYPILRRVLWKGVWNCFCSRSRNMCLL